ncbi:restriction endonuclease subunit S [uncultured Methanospirillum sp.]|uniref:restriction endonuclease subunit S n=1 Tax=uncultured Methanospirillum sp. TaxID=262503 RepID=UPI0029C84387|nr:restriction endonuclease subunit S [uncultured Methanospirillum sp.]
MTNEIKNITIRGGNLQGELRTGDAGVIGAVSGMKIGNKGIPKGWILTELSIIADIFDVDHKMPKAVDHGVLFISPKDFNGEDNIDFKNAKQISEEDYFRLSKKCHPDPGDLLFSRIGTIGKVRIVPRSLKFQISYSLCLIKVFNQNIYNKYLFWLLRSHSIQTQSHKKKRSIGVPDLGLRDIRSFSIPLPPLNEQNRIVSKIEELFTQLDAGIASLQEVQDKLFQYRKAVLKHAFEGKLTEAWREAHMDEIEPASVLLERIREERRKDKKYKELLPVNTEGLPDLPEGWVWVRIKEVGDSRLGRQRAPKHHNGENMRPYLRVANVYEDRIEASDIKEMNFTPEEFVIYHLQYGDILLNEGQSKELVGRPAIYRDEVPNACFTNTLIRFRVYSCLLPEFALTVFRGYLHNGKFEKIARWTTNIAHLGGERFADLEFPLPPMQEQEQIVLEVNRQLSIIDHLEKEFKLYILQSTQLRQSILKKAFEGRLVPQDPSDEPASVLLDRIRQEKLTAEPKKRGRKNHDT